MRTIYQGVERHLSPETRDAQADRDKLMDVQSSIAAHRFAGTEVPAGLIADECRLVMQERTHRPISLCGVPVGFDAATAWERRGLDRVLDAILDDAVTDHIGARAAEDVAGDMMSDAEPLY